MAGDWIKIRTDLLTSPKVVRMASALKADRFRTVGGLLSVWSLFDAHSDDGFLVGYSAETLDSLAAWDGFAHAMELVEWLVITDEGLEIPRFSTHNGASAKRRAQDADRKRSVRNLSASDADKMRTREEKRREENKSTVEQDEKPDQEDQQKRVRAKDETPYQAILEIYQRVCGGTFKGAELLNDSRKRAIKKAWNLKIRGKHYFQDLEWIEHKYLPACLRVAHYRGENDRDWRADLEFVFRESTILKVLEV